MFIIDSYKIHLFRLSLGNSFEKDVAGQSFELVNDDGSKKLQNQMKWY